MTFSLKTILWAVVATSAWLASIVSVQDGDPLLAMAECFTGWIALGICYIEWRMGAALALHFGGPILCLLMGLYIDHAADPYEVTATGCFLVTVFGFPASVFCLGKNCVDTYANRKNKSASN